MVIGHRCDKLKCLLERKAVFKLYGHRERQISLLDIRYVAQTGFRFLKDKQTGHQDISKTNYSKRYSNNSTSNGQWINMIPINSNGKKQQAD